MCLQQPIIKARTKSMLIKAKFLLMTILCVSVQTGCFDPTQVDLTLDYGRIREEICGDRILSRNEQCDDGNQIDGDGCSSVCLIEYVPQAGMWVNESTAGDELNDLVTDEGPSSDLAVGDVVEGGEMNGVTSGEMGAGTSSMIVDMAWGDTAVDQHGFCAATVWLDMANNVMMPIRCQAMDVQPRANLKPQYVRMTRMSLIRMLLLLMP